ncbi:MAG TPA: hypothetical protein VFY63_15090, partial [Pseudorhizobium sp.]|nr:hypothetical protein [Pseudorhizobium sp.]
QIQAVRDLVNEHPDGSITDRSGAVPSSGRLPGVYYLEVELHNALVDYQNANPSNPAQLDLLDWCGGDFVGYVKVVSNPPDAAIKLLTQFSFEVCEALGKDPYSNDCEDWRQVTSEAIPAGLYKYVAAWPTGEVTCETVDLTPANGWPEGNEEPTIEIPKGGTSSCQPDSSSRSMSP